MVTFRRWEYAQHSSHCFLLLLVRQSQFKICPRAKGTIHPPVIHVIQAAHYRLWWLYPTVCLAGVGEIIGWGGRLWSSKDVWNLNPFLMQSVVSTGLKISRPLTCMLAITL